VRSILQIPPQNPLLTKYAKKNRATHTKGEAVFWASVRNRRFDGLKFKRQMPLGKFIVDFYCDEYKLIVEIDGKGHDYVIDTTRDAWLVENGYNVVHINDEIVITSTELAMNKIRNVIRNLTFNLTPNLSPKGEGNTEEH
jgi:very-short-patch-repair endonuclease